MAPLSRVLSNNETPKTALFEALSDLNFESTQVVHCRNVENEWKKRKLLGDGYGKRFWEPVREALEEWRDSDKRIDITIVTQNLTTILHQSQIPIYRLWWLLKDAIVYTTAEQQVGQCRELNEQHICSIVVHAICARLPFLAVESSNPKSSPQPEYYTFLIPGSPLNAAVQAPGLPHVAKLFLSYLKQHLDEHLQSPSAAEEQFYNDLRGTEHDKLLCDAIRSGSLNMVEVILELCPLVDKHGDVLYELLRSDSNDIIELVLRYREDLKTEVALEEAIGTNDKRRVELFFDEKLLSMNAAMEVVEKGSLEIWNIPKFKEACVALPGSGCLLHVAVKHCREEMVEYLAEATTGAIMKDSSGHYPLWYNQPDAMGKDSIGREARSRLRPSSAGTSIQNPKIRAASDSYLGPPIIRHGRSVSSAMTPKLSVNTTPMTELSPLNTPVFDHDDSLKRESIRNMLIAQIIRRCNPPAIYDIVHESKDTVNEYTLDLSAIDTRKYQFKNLVRSLTQPDLSQPGDSESDISDSELSEFDTFHSIPRARLTFESTLLYVETPSLYSELSDAQKEFSEIGDLLVWLKRKRQVTTIMDLTILDRLWGSLDEKRIAEWLDGFNVSRVHWRCQDLSFGLFSEKVKRQITSIHLYSSGRRAVHDYWFGAPGTQTLFDTGLAALSNVETVFLSVIEDLLPKRRAKDAVTELQRRADEFSAKIFNQKQKKVQISVTSDRWYGETPVEDTSKLENIAVMAVPELNHFLESYRKLETPHMRRIKVAVIDNGIMAVGHGSSSSEVFLGANGSIDRASHRAPRARSGIMDRVVAGESFVYRENGRKSSWYVAADAHGTQMASLICAVDPLCQIYIAKVGDRHSDVTPQRVEKAIRWAITHDVDVISMSFAFYAQTDGLKDAIQKADNKQILMLASTHDEGSNQSEAYPASYGEVTTIAASDSFGSILHFTPTKGYQYRLNGMNVFAGTVPFIESKPRINGSSVATALAAGLASLILSCHFLTDGQHFDSVHWRRDMIRKFFNQMVPDGNSKNYVMLKKFCKLDEIKSEQIDAVNAKDQMEYWFPWENN